MDGRNVYVWMKDADHESLAAFFAAYGNIAVRPVASDLVLVSFPDDPEPHELQRLRELAVQDFIRDFTAFIVPLDAGYPVEAVLRELPRLGPGVYGVTEIAVEAVLRGFPVLKATLRKYYYDLLGTEIVDTAVGFIRADQNASRASKGLYMHRNTLNYRLDQFVDRTGIDVRSFKGALAAYLLFRA
jgi:hypothetical protein